MFFDVVLHPIEGFKALSRGEVSEWLKEHAWKVCIRETVSRVRIPLSPHSKRIGPKGPFWFGGTKETCFLKDHQTKKVGIADDSRGLC